MQIISSVARCDNLAAAGAFSQNFCELPSNTQRLYRSVRLFPPLRQLCRLETFGAVQGDFQRRYQRSSWTRAPCKVSWADSFAML